MSLLGAYAVLVGAPTAALIVAVTSRRAMVASHSNLVAAVIAFVAGVMLVPLCTSGPVTFLDDYLILDPLAAWVILCVAVVYLLSALYAIGDVDSGLDSEMAGTRFHVLLSGFAITMFVAPAMNNPGMYWIAIELTTLVSTFLVGFDRTVESIEAAWKYIIVVSAGISLALLGTLLWYWAGTFVFGSRYDMTWALLQQAGSAGHNPLLIVLGFLLILAGYGTKVGLAPFHTWLPDAHSQAPTPVSAMLSGALLNTAMVGIVRALRVTDAAAVGWVPRGGVILLGLVSLVVAAFLIVRQTGVKRLMAYSSVEHMGVVALGFGFGGPLGVTAALYHMLNHSLNKSLMFFGAGHAAHAFGTKHIGDIRRILDRTRLGGGLWLAGAVAITGAPPFALFRSEFATLWAGIAAGQLAAVALILVTLVLVFIGFLNHFRAMYFTAQSGAAPAEPDSTGSAWRVAPMWLAFVPLLVLGIWWPESLTRFLGLVATEGIR